MKKCPYCGRDNTDDRTNCQYCYAGFPNEKSKEEKSSETDNPRNLRRKLRS